MEDASQFDDNILQEILSRLPAKTLAQLKCICRRWRALISSPLFACAQAASSIDNVLGLLHVTATHSGGQLGYLPIDGALKPPTITLGISEDERITIMAACNGLLFCKLNESCRHILANPTTNSFRQICRPPVNEFWVTSGNVKFGLAFDPTVSQTTLKIVVCEITYQTFIGFDIYTPEIDTWLESDTTMEHPGCTLVDSASAAFCNGALHWLTEKGDILAFDVGTERACTMSLPVDARAMKIHEVFSDLWFGVVQGRMTVVKLDEGGVHVWEMVDYGRRRWELKKCIRECVGYYRNNVPVFYDSERFVVLTWSQTMEQTTEEAGLAVYRIGAGQWERFVKLEWWMDPRRRFFPFVSLMV